MLHKGMEKYCRNIFSSYTRILMDSSLRTASMRIPQIFCTSANLYTKKKNKQEYKWPHHAKTCLWVDAEKEVKISLCIRKV